MTVRTEIRRRLIDFLQRELVGPEQQQEILNTSPCQRYSAGVLFPLRQQLSPVDDLTSAGGDERDDGDLEPGDEGSFEPDGEPDQPSGAERAEEDGSVHDDTVLLANSFLPSAMGLTFVLRQVAAEIEVQVSAARYTAERDEDGFSTQWQRVPLHIQPVTFRIDEERSRTVTETTVADGDLHLRLVTRRRHDGSRVTTVSLYNGIRARAGGPPAATDCFFQAGFEVRSPDGDAPFREHRGTVEGLSDPEADSLELLYRKRRVFAIGHGCAADWDIDHGGSAVSVATRTIPMVAIPPISPRSDREDFLSMELLAGQGPGEPQREVPALLDQLVERYEEWVAALEGELDQVPDRLQTTGRRHLTDCRTVVERMRHGIDTLRRDQRCLDAFVLANRAMLMQQYHNARPRRSRDADFVPLPSEYRTGENDLGQVFGYWHNFQLAFILMNLPAFAPGELRRHRDIVDVIWFLTGGGKTEAYLGLAAYCIFLRRLLEPDNGGTTVLMRYTLRLLTAQQFQRASSLVCACEMLRQQLVDEGIDLGEDRISIGLWVGQSLTPNRRDEAFAALNRLARRDEREENPFQILSCPWCGTAMDESPMLGYRRVRVAPTRRERTVKFICPAPECPFGTSSNHLPVTVIDQDLYETPPTLVIGTVDKFAMLAWRPEAGALFGISGNGSGTAPPELIIQDELHLIAGPLGSMVGLYESIIELLCRTPDAGPKIVASTATIRRAASQCKALYDRDAFQFPPPAFDISDSWFAVEDTSTPSRVYIGVLPTASPSPVTALVRTGAGLLQGIKTIELPDGADEADRDPYWTLVQYFGSLRELGRASTLIEADIPEYLGVMKDRLELDWDDVRRLGYPVELTSRRTAAEIPRILEQLEIQYPGTDEANPLNTLLATNMISVGVDIDRLGLMLVVGQPKTTSEYIQASSRVGRSTSAPGLIVTLYNAGKPRDRSHYEQFRGYHESFYRFVEPTSLTPFSLPVLERALAGLLVTAARQLARLSNPADIDSGIDDLERVSQFLLERARSVDPEHEAAVENKVRKLLSAWAHAPPEEWGGFGEPPETRPLMHPAGSEPRPEWQGLSWAVPTSMRNVDVECWVIVAQDHQPPADSNE